jgi:hypothetical protein
MQLTIEVPDNLAREASVPPDRLAEVVASVVESNVGLVTEHWLGWFDDGTTADEED